MGYLCRTCTHPVETNTETNTAYCANCGKELEPTETISSWKLEARVAQLKAMHELMCNANDELIYGTWIYVMPDEPSDEDIKYIALDDDLYNECFDLFVKLIKKDGNRW